MNEPELTAAEQRELLSALARDAANQATAARQAGDGAGALAASRQASAALIAMQRIEPSNAERTAVYNTWRANAERVLNSADVVIAKLRAIQQGMLDGEDRQALAVRLECWTDDINAARERCSIPRERVTK